MTWVPHHRFPGLYTCCGISTLVPTSLLALSSHWWHLLQLHGGGFLFKIICHPQTELQWLYHACLGTSPLPPCMHTQHRQCPPRSLPIPTIVLKSVNGILPFQGEAMTWRYLHRLLAVLFFPVQGGFICLRCFLLMCAGFSLVKPGNYLNNGNLWNYNWVIEICDAMFHV